MDTLQYPDKAQVRTWLAKRQRERTPPPDIAQIRRELGWGLIRYLPDRPATTASRPA